MAASNEQLCGLILVNSGWLMQPSQPCASLSTQLAKPRPHYLSPLDAFSPTLHSLGLDDHIFMKSPVFAFLHDVNEDLTGLGEVVAVALLAVWTVH